MNNLNELEELKKKLEEYRKLADKHRTSYRYRIGDAIVDALSSPKKFLKLPVIFYRLYKEEHKKINQTNRNVANNKENLKNAKKNILLDEYEKRILYVLHEGGGGTVETNKDLMKFVHKNNYDVFMLTSNMKQFKLYHVWNNEIQLLQKWDLHTTWDINNIKCDEYKKIYNSVLNDFNIDLVHVRHLFKHSFDIIDVCENINIPVILSFHDFYFVCPTVNLINYEGRYCDGDCYVKRKQCKINSLAIKISGSTSEWAQNVWKPEVKKILEKCSCYITTSQYTREVYGKVYPEILEKFYVIEHGREFDYPRNCKTTILPNEKIRILLAGNIDYNKGEEYICKLINVDEDNRIEWHCIGKIREELKEKVIYHGTYKREEFRQWVQEIAPAYVGIFSIWPETYCHVLTEAWSCGIPCVVSDIGTLKERGENHGCILADLDNPLKTYEQIIDISDNFEKYLRLQCEVQEASIKTLAEMGTEYLRVYKKVFCKGDVRTIYILKEDLNSEFAASAYIRIVSPIMKNCKLQKNSVLITIDDISKIVKNSAVSGKQFLIIQRNRINDSNLEKIEKIKNELDIKIIFEIDDDILAIDSHHKEYEYYISVQKKIKRIAELSDVITTTSNQIAIHLGYQEKTIIIPNYLDEKIWSKIGERNFGNENQGKRKIIKILYAGSKTHENDLKILEEIIPEVKRKVENNLECDLYIDIIGGSDDLSNLSGITNVIREYRTYPQYARWLQENNDYDIAIAPLDSSIEFNSAKSYLKYLEYSALGLAGVYSKISPYEQVIVNGENGMLANSNKEWIDALYNLIENDNLRLKIARNATEDLLNNHLLNDHIEQWAEIFD